MPLSTPKRLLVPAMLLWCCLVLFVDYLAGADWTNWRGPRQTGVSLDLNLPASWSDDAKKPENFLWKVPYGCRSTPMVMNGRVYINNQVGKNINEQERVMCFDADTGKVLWEKRFNVFHSDIVSIRLGWSNLAGDPATGNVYWHGTQGFLTCFDKDGKILWQRSLTEEYGRVSGYGGRLPGPTLVGDLVVIAMVHSAWGDHAKGGNRFLAVNKHDGKPVWWSEPGEKPLNTYYSTPVVATINDQLLLISGGADGGVHAMQAGTGKKVWSYKFSAGAINSSPVVDRNFVYCCAGEESPDNNIEGRIVCLDAGNVKDGKPTLVWQKDGKPVKYTTPIVHAGKLFVCEDVARLWCFDTKDGKVLWKYGYARSAMGSPVWGDGKIYVTDQDGSFHILEPDAKECRRLHEYLFPPPPGVSDVEIYSTPAIAKGRVYVSTRDELYCLGRKDAKPAQSISTARTPKKGSPAQLLIYPCDIVAHPGDEVLLKLKAYDEFGNYVEEVAAGEVKWTLPQPPSPPGGKYQPPALQAEINAASVPVKLKITKAPAAQQGLVEAMWSGLKAKARVRVAPILPYAEDFDKVPEGSVPASWVNCQGKYLVKTLSDGNRVLAKVTDNSSPLIARGSCFVGNPELKDYTIEADVMGGEIPQQNAGEIWLPDVGVGACRYTLVLAGQTQTLRLISWDAMPRVDKSMAFGWKSNTWYRLKLQAGVENGQMMLRGKVWPRSKQEPLKWDIEFVDPTPNVEGSPFLYGYVLGHGNNTPGTEVMFDNVTVKSNKQ